MQVNSVINGQASPASGPDLELIDPSSGTVFAGAPVATGADVDRAVAAAREAFGAWRNTTPGERQAAILKIANLIEDNADELVRLESQNTGKPIPVTHAEEIPPMVDQVRFFAGAARILEGRSAGEYMSGFTSMIRREPVGVIAQVTPWNYPLMMAIWKFIPAIAAGNAVVLKPSDTTPVSTVRLAEMISEAELLPPGVLNVITGDRDTGRTLVSHDGIDMAAITGSVRAGMQVAEEAAKSVKRVHLELGGKAPVVVFDDADAAKAAEWLAVAGYFNAGQDCTAATRILAQDGIHDEFVAALAEQAVSTKTTFDGGAEDEDALVPPLNNQAQMEKVMGFIERLPEHATIAAGGTRPGDRGFYIDPTVVVDMNQKDEAIQNEIFGPVITVQRFSTDEEAVAMANGVMYGLASSVWTENHGRALRMAKALDFGTVWINTHIPLVAEMPHGGFKQSGYGKDLSLYGLEDYTRIKHVMSAIED